MNKIYLSSDIHFVAKSIMSDIKSYKKSYKTAFITTGAEEMENTKWIDDNRQGMVDAGFELFDYTLTGKTPEQINKDLEKADIIHVNGGRCKRIVEKAKKSGFDKWIKKAIENGVVFTGSSGGSIAAAPDVSSIYRQEDEFPIGLDLVPILIVPHWGRLDRPKLYLEERLPKIYDEKHKLVMLNDAQFIKFEDERMKFVDVRDKL